MPVIGISNYFQTSPSFTDVVSYSTDAFGAVAQKQFTLAQAVQAGDVINASGALWGSGDATAFVVVSEHVVEAGTKYINVLRAPNVGSLVCLKSDNLVFASRADKAAGIAFLQSQGFQTQEFFTS